MEGYSSRSYPAAASTNKSSHNSVLHSVRKAQAKPWKKATVAPPTPIRVYKVDAINFRELVQQLTGAPDDQKPMLSTLSSSTTNWYQQQGAQSEALQLNLSSSSSSSYNWFSVPLPPISQGNITS